MESDKQKSIFLLEKDYNIIINNLCEVPSYDIINYLEMHYKMHGQNNPNFLINLRIAMLKTDIVQTGYTTDRNGDETPYVESYKETVLHWIKTKLTNLVKEINYKANPQFKAELSEQDVAQLYSQLKTINSQSLSNNLPDDIKSLFISNKNFIELRLSNYYDTYIKNRIKRFEEEYKVRKEIYAMDEVLSFLKEQKEIIRKAIVELNKEKVENDSKPEKIRAEKSILKFIENELSKLEIKGISATTNKEKSIITERQQGLIFYYLNLKLKFTQTTSVLEYAKFVELTLNKKSPKPENSNLYNHLRNPFEHKGTQKSIQALLKDFIMVKMQFQALGQIDIVNLIETDIKKLDNDLGSI